MKAIIQRLRSTGISVLLHLGCFLGLLLVRQSFPKLATELKMESIFAESTELSAVEDMTRELERLIVPAQTSNVIAGGTITDNVGGTPSSRIGTGGNAQPGSSPVNVQKSAVMREGNVRPAVGELALPTDALIGEELGEGNIAGEVGAIVEGYGAAMSIITQEVTRMMRHDKVTVIWLFDESGSMEDDRKEIRENYLRVYDELGIVAKQDSRIRRSGNDELLTVVASYGKEIHEHTAKPTADKEKIKAAIDNVKTDSSGEENMCRSIAAIIGK